MVKQSCLSYYQLSYYHCRWENSCMHTFLKGIISAMWNANSLVQDLNSCRCVHFKRQQPLQHGQLHIECMSVCYLSVCECCNSNTNHIYLTPPLGQDMTQGQFLFFNRFEFSFPSPRLVASPRLENLICPTIYP